MAATPGTNTSATLSEMFKVHYANEEVNLLDWVSDAAKILKAVKFSEQEGGLGLEYQQPVVVSTENGFTYAGNAAGAFDLNGSLQASVVKAKVTATNLVLQARLDYETAARAKKGAKAFISSTEWVVKNMMESTSRRLEAMFLYGGTGIGAITSVNAGALQVTLTAASFAAGLLAGLEGGKIDIYQSNNSTLRTANITVANIDMDTRTLTFAAGTVMTGIVAGDLLYYAGAKGNECLGLDAIISTQTGTLFNVDVGLWSLYRGSVYDVGTAALTVTHINRGLLKAVNKGCTEGGTLYVSVNAWLGFVDPVVDPASTNARVKPVEQSKKLSFGASSIELQTPAGTVKVEPHLMVKDGEAFFIPLKRLRRIGASDITFKTPGMDDEIFLQLQANAGVELRCYANQALFVERPGFCVKFKNIAPA
jgi:hypothetical protein